MKVADDRFSMRSLQKDGWINIKIALGSLRFSPMYHMKISFTVVSLSRRSFGANIDILSETKVSTTE